MSPAIRATEEKYGIKSDVLPPRLQKQLDDLLAPDEEILWQGQPAPPKGAFSGCFLPAMSMGMFLVWPLMAPFQNHEGSSLYIVLVILGLLLVATMFGLYDAYCARTASDNTAYVITSSRILVLKPKMRVDSIPPEQISRRKFSWDSQGYETLSLPTGKTYLSAWTLPDGSSEIVAVYSYIARLKDIRLINRLIVDTFEKPQPQLSIAPINSFTSPI